MKPSALEVLVCPRCNGALDLRVLARDRNEVDEGILRCRACDAAYAVVRGIPRFVEGGAYAATFGFQWNRFRTVQLDSANGRDESARALEATTGWAPAQYHGARVLDAGVGAGRFAEIAARHGAEVFGIDLSRAVDAAYLNVGRREGIHLIQADIFAMPFRHGTFDLAYSIGVLHHTPDARAAFERVASAVRPGGQLAVYVYDRYGPVHHAVDGIRSMTTHLPHGAALALSAAAIPLYYVYRLPLVGKVLRAVWPISMHPDWRWRWLDTFDTYTPQFQWKFLYPEVFRWFTEQGFRDVQIFDGPIRMRGTKEPSSGADGISAGGGRARDAAAAGGGTR